MAPLITIQPWAIKGRWTKRHNLSLRPGLQGPPVCTSQVQPNLHSTLTLSFQDHAVELGAHASSPYAHLPLQLSCISAPPPVSASPQPHKSCVPTSLIIQHQECVVKLHRAPPTADLWWVTLWGSCTSGPPCLPQLFAWVSRHPWPSSHL